MFAVLGSGVVAVTLAVLVSVPTAVGLTMMVTVAVAALASVPILHVMVVVPVQVPAVEFAETSVGPAGKRSVSVTPAAEAGPLFFTVRV